MRRERHRSARRAPVAPPLSVREFSDVVLRCGHRRQITIVYRAGDRPGLSIARFDANEKPIGKPTIFRVGRELSVLQTAIRMARDPSLRGRMDAGILPHRETLLYVWAVATDGKPPAVCFGRHKMSGVCIGGQTSIYGDELAALERAARALQRMSALVASQERGVA
jgi:hypothetical protein